MDKRQAAVRLQQAVQEKFGVKAKIKTGGPGSMTVFVNGKTIFDVKTSGIIPETAELLRRMEAAAG